MGVGVSKLISFILLYFYLSEYVVVSIIRISNVSLRLLSGQTVTLCVFVTR